MDIHDICTKYGITNYTINNGVVDVSGDVNLSGRKLTELPLKFGKVTGNFHCSYNILTTLIGPTYVGESFYCNSNNLTSLIGGPTYVNTTYNCGYNKLTDLIGSPNEVNNFYCYVNNLTLKGSPSNIVDEFNCVNNPIHEHYKTFDNHQSFLRDTKLEELL